MIEKREAQRFACEDILIQEERGDFKFVYELKDLSLSGAFVAERITDGTQAARQMNSIRILDPRTGKSIELDAQIVREDFSNERSGSGVQFVFSNEETRNKLKDLIDSLPSGQA